MSDNQDTFLAKEVFKFTFLLLALFSGSKQNVIAQFLPITHTRGVQNVGGTSITVTPQGNGVGTFNNWCNTGPYWIGFDVGGNAGGYAFSFATPVYRVKVDITAINEREIISFYVNGRPYMLDDNNVSIFSGCPEEPLATISGNTLSGFTWEAVGGSAEVIIKSNFSDIDSVSILANGRERGSVFSISYYDTCAAFNAQVSLLSCNLDSDGVVLSATPGFQSYKWMNEDFSLVIDSGNTVYIRPASPTYYNVIITANEEKGCRDTFRTPMFASIQLETGSADTVCYETGQPISLEAIASGGMGALSYTWKPSNTLDCDTCATVTARPVVPNAVYTVTVTDTNGCYKKDTVVTIGLLNVIEYIYAGVDTLICNTEPFQLSTTVSPAGQSYSYTWFPNDQLNKADTSHPIHTPKGSVTETFIVSVSDGYCHKLDTVTVRFLSNEFELNDTTVCQGNKIKVGAYGDTAFSYSWMPATGLSDPTILRPYIVANVPQKFIVTASYPGCPDVIRNYNLSVEPNPTVYIGPDTTKCQWEELYLYSDVTSDWPTEYRYLWQQNNYISNNKSPYIMFYGPADTMLILTVTTPVGCIGSDSINIKVHPGDFASVTPTDTTICPHSIIHFTAKGGANYEWYPTSHLSDPLNDTVVSSPITSMDYTIYATDQYGCQDTVIAHVRVASDALIELEDSILTYPGAPIQLTPKSNCLYFNWFPEAGLSNQTISNPLAMPDVNTRYFVKGITEAGCVAIDSIDVIVNLESLIDIPNAFTPGNINNEQLKIISKGAIILKQFKIFNRWGSNVFSTNNIDTGWDGKFNGNVQPSGVYVYSIEAYTNTGKMIFKQGNITLIR